MQETSDQRMLEEIGSFVERSLIKDRPDNIHLLAHNGIPFVPYLSRKKCWVVEGYLTIDVVDIASSGTNCGIEVLIHQFDAIGKFENETHGADSRFGLGSQISALFK